MWDAQSGLGILSVDGFYNADSPGTHCVAFSPNDAYVAFGGDDNEVKLLDARTGVLLQSFKGHEKLICGVAFVPASKRLLSGGWDQTVKLWNIDSGEEIRTLKGHAGRVNSVTFSPDGTRIVSACEDLTIKFWDAASGREMMSLGGHMYNVASIAFSPDGKQIAVGTETGIIEFLDATPEHEITMLKGHSDPIVHFSFSDDGRQVYAESKNEKLCWDLATRELAPNAAWDPPSTHTPVSPDDRRLIISDGNNLLLIDLQYKDTPREKSYRDAKGRFYPAWHQEWAEAATVVENWYAAAFHYALLMKNDPDQASYYDGLQAAYQKLRSQFDQEELNLEPHLAMVVKESLKLPRGNKLTEIPTGEAQAINNTTWHKVSTSDAFEQTTLTDLELIQFRELIRQHPRDIYFNTLATAEYRMGNYQEAIQAALRSVEMSPQAFPGDYAILAMSYAEFGDTVNAVDYRERFDESMQLDAFKNDETCKLFSAEVERTFKSVVWR